MIKSLVKDAILESQQLPPELDAIFAAMEDGLVVLTPEARILRANSAFASMLGLPLEQIIGNNSDDLLQSANAANGLSSLGVNADNYLNGEYVNIEFFGKQSQRLRARVTPVRDQQDEPGYYIMAVRDISDIVQRERELARAEQLALVCELAAGLAHEIKNPLAGIQGAMDILIQRLPEDNPDRTVLESVRREASRIDAAIGGLIERARMRHSRIAVESLNRAVSRAVVFARDQIAGNSNIQIELVTPATPIKMPIDAAQVEDAVLNLLLNAIEALSGNGRIVVRIRDDHQSSPHGEAIIEVEDNGRGIPAAELSKIFSPFYTTKPNGTGLGLPAVRRIARAHNGRVDVKSAPGQGTTFTLTLPF